MSGSVCEVPQTRKTTKRCTNFLISRYNRDLYTNGYLLPDFILFKVARAYFISLHLGASGAKDAARIAMMMGLATAKAGVSAQV